MLSFLHFLLETAQRIEGIKKAHTPSLVKYMKSENPDQLMNWRIHDGAFKNHIIDHYNERADAFRTEHPDKDFTKEHAAPMEHWAHHVIDTAAAADPDQKHHKHTEWMVNQWKKGNVRLEDMGGAVKDTLSHFMKLGHKLPNKDLNSYKHIADLRTALRPHLDNGVTDKVVEGLDKHPGAERVHTEPGLVVHKLNTIEASKEVRRCDPSNSWCTSRLDSGNYFDRYHKPDDPLYVVHAEDQEGKVNRYQFHFGVSRHSGSFADHTDSMHEPEDLVKKYPKLKNVAAFHQYGLNSLPFVHDPASHIRGMADSEHPEIRTKLAQHLRQNAHNITANDSDKEKFAPILDKLSKDKEHNVRYSVSHIPGQHLSNLVNDEDDPVRYNIAQIPGPHQEAMVGDKNSRIREALVVNSNKNPVIRKALLSDPKENVAHALIKSGTSAELDKMMKFHEKSPDILAMIAREGKQKHVDALYNHKDENVRWNAAMNTKYASSHLDAFSKDKAAGVRKVVAGRAGPHLMNMINDPDVENRDAVAKHSGPHLDHMINDPSPRIRRTVASHGIQAHLDVLAKDPDDSVRRNAFMYNGPHVERAVSDPGTPYPDFETIAAHHGHPMAFQRMMEGASSSDKIRMAQQSSGGKHHLLLAQDPDPKVRRAAILRGTKIALEHVAKHETDPELRHLASTIPGPHLQHMADLAELSKRRRR